MELSQVSGKYSYSPQRDIVGAPSVAYATQTLPEGLDIAQRPQLTQASAIDRPATVADASHSLSPDEQVLAKLAAREYERVSQQRRRDEARFQKRLGGVDEAPRQQGQVAAAVVSTPTARLMKLYWLPMQG